MEEIVAAALRVGTTKGFGALTMRVLADELGVSAMTPYYHLPNKDALVTLVIDAVLAHVEVPPPSFGDWSARLRELTLRANAVFHEYPGVDLLVFGNAMTAEGRRIKDGSIQIMVDGGFTQRNALVGFNILHANGVGRWVIRRRHPGVAPEPAGGRKPSSETVGTAGELADSQDDLDDMADTVILHGLRRILAEQDAAAGADRRGPVRQVGDAADSQVHHAGSPRSRAGPPPRSATGT